MKKAKRFLVLVLAAALAAVMLTGCKEALTGAARKLVGSSGDVQEEDTTQWAEATTDALDIEGISDPTAKYTTAFVSTRLNIVFNSIWSRQTTYFTVPNGTLTITGYGSTDGGTQKYKVAVWRKVDGGAQYVNGTTYYYKTDGQNYRCVITGLDPAERYRLTISYDSSRYYLSGALQLEGVAQ